MSICPKDKSSKARRDKRRANWKMSAPNLVKCSKCGIPAALQDLFSELCTGGHDSSSLQNKRFCSFLPIVIHFGRFFNLFALKIQISASGAKNKMYFC